MPAPPYWKDGQLPEDVNTAEEESAQFNCEVEGVPTPEISWLVNGIPIGGMFVTFDIYTTLLTFICGPYLTRDYFTVITCWTNSGSYHFSGRYSGNFCIYLENIVSSGLYMYNVLQCG